MRIKSPNRTPYLSRRDQFRLLMMVGLIGMVVVAMDYAGRPESYGWLFGQSDSKKPAASKNRKQPEIDFRPNLESTPDGIQVTQLREPKDAALYHATAGQSADQEAKHDLKIAPELISQIKDNSVGIRPAERDLKYYLLAKTRKIPLAQLKKAARDDIAFGVLMNESKTFLGTLMTVKGEVRRILPDPIGKNEYGVDKAFEVCLFNRETGKSPYRIICSSLPKGIPQGEALESGTIVTVTGYYFKRIGYLTESKRLHVAPLIIAGTLEWHRPASATRPNDMDIIPYIIGIASVIGVVAAFTLYRFRKSDREFERQHLKRLTGASSDAILAIDSIPTLEIGEALRQMGDNERSESADS
jgi:hypothetical protein